MMAAGTPAASPMHKPNDIRSLVANVCWMLVSVRENSRLYPALSVNTPRSTKRMRVKIQSVQETNAGEVQV